MAGIEVVETAVCSTKLFPKAVVRLKGLDRSLLAALPAQTLRTSPSCIITYA